MKTTIGVVLTAILVAIAACAASAQIGLGTGVFATGGGMMSNGTYAAAGTIGQSVIGRSTGATFAASAGFWGDGGVILEIEEPPATETPTEFALRQNYPNPFNPTTSINYQIPNTSHVRLKVFNALGQEVATLVDEAQVPGYKSVEFDGARLSSGVYFYRLTTEDFVATKKIVLMK